MSEAVETDEYVDPFILHARRATVKGAAVLVVQFDAGDPDNAAEIAAGLCTLLEKCGHEAEAQVVASRDPAGLGAVLEAAVTCAAQPLVLVSSAVAAWSMAHVEPLLKAIEAADHVVGRRPAGFPTNLLRRARALARGVLFANPVVDIHSPCRIHRREKIAAIPLQSESNYLDQELLAKATFLRHLIAEVPIPELAEDTNPVLGSLARHDFMDVFRHPRFGRLRPAEDAQREEERDGGPSGEDQQRGADLDKAGPFEDHHA